MDGLFLPLILLLRPLLLLGDGTAASYKKKYVASQQTVREYEDKLKEAEKRFRQEKR